MPRAKRIGLFGGTFDPIHYGHVRAVRALRRAARLDEVWVIPVRIPPHRASPPAASAAERLQMVRLALQGSRGVRACGVEVERPGPSYTVRTVRQLQRQYPAVSLVLLLGADAALPIRTWHRFRELLRRIDVVVFPRRSAPAVSFDALVRRGFVPERLQIVRIEAPAIAARTVRAQLRAGGSVRGLIPPRVEAYIRRRNLYRVHRRRRRSAMTAGKRPSEPRTGAYSV